MMVSVFFSKEFRPKKRSRDKIAEALLRVIEKNSQIGDWEMKELGWEAGLPLEVEAVTIRCFSSLTEISWDFGAGGMVLENCEKEIQKKLDDKERKIEAYREKCQSCWLLIVADWRTNASALIWPSKEAQDHQYFSSFEKVFFLDPILEKVVELKVVGNRR